MSSLHRHVPGADAIFEISLLSCSLGAFLKCHRDSGIRTGAA